MRNFECKFGFSLMLCKSRSFSRKFLSVINYLSLLKYDIFIFLFYLIACDICHWWWCNHELVILKKIIIAAVEKCSRSYHPNDDDDDDV